MFKKLKYGVPKWRLDFLRQVPMLEGLPDKVLARIDNHLDEVNVPAGHQLTVEGRGSHEAFIIEDGTAEVRIGDEVVGETVVGEMIGELGLLKHTQRAATVTATTPMRLLVINPRDMRWLTENKTLSERIRDNLAKHTRDPG